MSKKIKPNKKEIISCIIADIVVIVTIYIGKRYFLLILNSKPIGPLSLIFIFLTISFIMIAVIFLIHINFLLIKNIYKSGIGDGEDVENGQ